MRWSVAGVALTACLAAASAGAAEIKVGLAAGAQSADPLYHDTGPNNALAFEIFDRLVRTDETLHLQPDLATSWKLLNDNSWQFNLRQGVAFQNGKPFTANDVVYTLCRAIHANDTGSYNVVSRDLTGIDVPDDHTVVLHTRGPDPILLGELANIAILSAETAGAGTMHFSLADQCGMKTLPTTADYDSGKLAIGTGPYSLEKFVPGTQAVLRANSAYFGRKPRWDRATLLTVPQDGPRAAGLLSGDFDLIENPSPEDFPTFKRHGGIAWTITPSNRIIFLQPDIGRAKSPQVDAPDGKNPLQDPRVREAISLGIDRKAITARILDGMGVPADQYLPSGLFGSLASPPPRPYDPAAAKKLLAEAGYPNGFSLTLAATNDRYIDDAEVAQAVAQFLTRIGIHTTLNVMPQTVFFPDRYKRSFSLSLAGWGFATGEASNIMRPFMVTTDAKHGLGQSNYGGYSSPGFDTPFLRAITDMDDASRAKLLQQATLVALHDNALIPLYWETSAWAFKDKYTFQGRMDQETNLDDLRLK
jgi:peptide/nickel transport system substrate-binding protein